MQAIKTIKRPIVTEKGIKLAENGKYTFFVTQKATKIDVKNSIKELYGVEVDTVRMVIIPKKTRNYGKKVITKRQKMKKAIVTLKDGKKIDVTKILKEKK